MGVITAGGNGRRCWVEVLSGDRVVLGGPCRWAGVRGGGMAEESGLMAMVSQGEAGLFATFGTRVFAADACAPSRCRRFEGGGQRSFARKDRGSWFAWGSAAHRAAWAALGCDRLLS